MTLPQKEWITYTCIIIICVLLFWLIVPSSQCQPKGIALPIPAATANQIMQSPHWNSTRKPVAWINLEYHVTQDTPGARAKAMQKATELANSAGGSAMVMQPLFYAAPMPNNNMLNVIIGRGIATK